MISFISASRTRYGEQETVIENYRGKSTDTRPTLPRDRNGSTFYEMDTGDVWMWDGDTLTWLTQ